MKKNEERSQKNKTKMEKYEELQAMVIKDATTVAEKVYKKKGSQYGVVKAPIHYHNGVDLPQISEVEMIRSHKYGTFIIVDTSETFLIRNVPNTNSLTFYGFAANNADGTPATKRAMLNGTVEFGVCFGFSGVGAATDPDTSTVGIPFIQAANSITLDSATPTNSRVGTTGAYFAYAVDSGGIVAGLTVDTYDVSSITITSTVGTNWKIQGVLILK